MKRIHTLERTGVSVLAHPDSHPDSTAALVVEALARHAPTVVAEVFDAPGDAHNEPLITAWAERHGLMAESIVQRMMSERHCRAQGSGLAFLSVTPSPEGDADWCGRETHARNLPNPSVETLQEWLARAKALYKSRAALRGAMKRQPTFRWAEFVRHCDWFVQVHVLGMRPSQIAQAEGINRAGIERATTRIANRLGLKRRRWTRGAPKKV